MRRGLRIDVLELRVAIGMASAILALAIDLTAIAEAFEQLRNAARRNAMSHVAQRRGELGVAFRHPQQRSHRIAERRRLEQHPQIFEQRRILARQRQPSAAGASNFCSGDARRQIAQPAIDGAARDARRPRDRRYAAKPGRARLRRREQATPAFVESGTQSLISKPNRCFIDHAAVINQTSAARNPPGPIDSMISRHRLNPATGLIQTCPIRTPSFSRTTNLQSPRAPPLRPHHPRATRNLDRSTASFYVGFGGRPALFDLARRLAYRQNVTPIAVAPPATAIHRTTIII